MKWTDELVKEFCTIAIQKRQEFNWMGFDEECEPRRVPTDSRVAVRGAKVAVTVQAFDVAVTQRCQHETDGQYGVGGQSAPCEDCVNQGSADASVSVGEGVDRLELCMSEARLDEGAVRGAVDVPDEVIDQDRDRVGRGWNELGTERIPIGAADPVLDRTDAAMPFVGE